MICSEKKKANFIQKSTSDYATGTLSTQAKEAAISFT